MKVENWNGHAIRFVEKDGAWWAVAADVCKALDIENVSQAVAQIGERYEKAGICDVFSKYITLPIDPAKPKSRKTQEFVCVNETGLYELIFTSRKEEAVAFRHWVCTLLKSLREALGYEQWKVKAFTDSVRNHHLNMDIIKQALKPVDKVPYVKAHTIANKCLANIVGEKKAIGKDDLKERYPQMTALRDEILTDTAKLMEVNGRFNLGVSVSKAIYRKYGAAAARQEGAV
jgi:prophage antirepressor-like protein